MNLEKAIEILDLNVRQRSPRMPPDVLDALKLGSEALKRCITLAQNNPLWAAKPLPGETEE
ncbi:hypothetical protein ES703_105355 [subsurface metagenome]